MKFLMKTLFNSYLISILAATASGSGSKNVYGDDLQSCSTNGMALTGYNRDGKCTDVAGLYLTIF